MMNLAKQYPNDNIVAYLFIILKYSSILHMFTSTQNTLHIARVYDLFFIAHNMKTLLYRSTGNC